MKKFFFITVIALGLWNCSNDGNLDNSNQKQTPKKLYINEINLNIDIKDGRLSFDKEADFYSAVQALNNYEAANETSKLRSNTLENQYGEPITSPNLSLKKYGFESLYDDFINAMNEAENYYDTEEGYMQFKERHSALFFAEQAEDYSAYLPVSNKTIAKLLNTKGEVEIEGEVKDFRDINSYQQLIDLSFVPEEDKLIDIKTLAGEVNRLSEVKCNDRKLWVKVRAEPGSFPGVGYDVLVEVCFRKKGFLGAWYNYSSETSLGWAGQNGWDKSGYSSHDYRFAIANVGVGQFRGTMWVQFRGFGSKCGGNKYYFDVNI